MTRATLVGDAVRAKSINFFARHVLCFACSRTRPRWFHNSVLGRSHAPLSRSRDGPFRYKRYADAYLDVAMRYAHVPVKAGGDIAFGLESDVPRR